MMFVDAHLHKDIDSTQTHRDTQTLRLGGAEAAGSECDLAKGLWEGQAGVVTRQSFVHTNKHVVVL